MKTALAIVGAKSLIGEAMADGLVRRGWKGGLHLLDAGDAVGETVEAGRRSLTVDDVSGFDFGRVAVTLFADEALAVSHADRAEAAGNRLIGFGAAFAGKAVPLVVAELNPEAIVGARIAVPGNSSTLLAVVLGALAEVAGLKRVNIFGCEAVSEYGNAGIEELGRQSADLLGFRKIETGVFPAQIAFNLLPSVGDADADGRTVGEARVIRELERLFPGMGVNATLVQAPVFFGNAFALHLEMEAAIAAEQAAGALRAAGMELSATTHGPSAVGEASGSDRIHVGRLRVDPSHAGGLDLWTVGDNIRRGTALNSIQIAEILLKEHP